MIIREVKEDWGWKKSLIAGIVAVSILSGLLLLIRNDPSANISPPVDSSSVPVTTTVPSEIRRFNARICVDYGLTLKLTEWPIAEVIVIWNKNERNLFTLTGTDCNGWLIVHVVSTQDYWGQTEFVGTNIVRTTFSDVTPPSARLHTVCHELGHVLGLPHSELGTCMSIDPAYDHPSDQELNQVKQNIWVWSNAARQSCAC